MLSSFDDAEDAVQETFLRAWRSRERLEGEVQYRPWLYRIATNVCLDVLRARGRRGGQVRSFAEVPWLQPYPDPLLDELAPSDDEPDAAVVRRETIELTFIAALQALPPRQRRRAHRQGRPGLAGDRDRRSARHERGGGEQRAATGADDDAGPPPRRALGVEGAGGR